MTADVLIYIGAGVITLWGITHIVPTKSVVDGFGELSTTNRRIITMEGIAEGRQANCLIIRKPGSSTLKESRTLCQEHRVCN